MGEVQHRQTFTQGVITQEQSLKLQLSEVSWMLLSCR